MKKALAILLAVFVAWSAMQPCMDGKAGVEPEVNCSAETLRTASSGYGCCASQTDAKEKDRCEDEEQEDGCTPFCSCQCCGMVFLQHTPEFKSVVPPSPVRQLMAYLPQVGQEFSYLIWQPPAVWS